MLYHIETGIEKRYLISAKCKLMSHDKLFLTPHSYSRENQHDKKHPLKRYQLENIWKYGKADMAKIDPFEIEVDDNLQVIKACYRLNLNKNDDVIMVIGYDGDRCFLKTHWINKVNDTHKTLRKDAYN